MKQMLQQSLIKNINLIQSLIRLDLEGRSCVENAELLHSGITVMCKSGKDRTGMLITLRETDILLRSSIINENSSQYYMDLLRGYGTRIRNAEKNTGIPQYMFNSLQNQFLPKELKAPKWNRGGGST